MKSNFKDVTILITGCSKLSKEIVDCLKNNRDRRKVRVISVDCNSNNVLRENVDRYYIAPLIKDPHYLDWLVDICNKEDVDVVLPYITAELPIIAGAKQELESRTKAKFSVASVECLSIVNNKEILGSYFGKYMPMQYVVRNGKDLYFKACELGYKNGTKICIKLTNKCGGAGFAIIDDDKAIDIELFNRQGCNRYISMNDAMEIADKNDITIILQEYIEGVDYSVCILADKGETVYECGFDGYSMNYGAVMSGMIKKNDEAYRIASEIVKKTNLDGNACFDFIIKNDGTPILLECNPRLSASLPFIAKAGIDLVYERCKFLLGEECGKQKDVKIRYGLKMGKYYVANYYIDK